MSGRIKHEVNVRPSYSATYSSRMRARHDAASEPARQIKIMEESHPGGRGTINMLSSGANQRTGAFDSFVVRRAPPPFVRQLLSAAPAHRAVGPRRAAARALRAHAAEPAARRAVCALPRQGVLGRQGAAPKDRAARGVFEGDPRPDRDIAQERSGVCPPFHGMLSCAPADPPS